MLILSGRELQEFVVAKDGREVGRVKLVKITGSRASIGFDGFEGYKLYRWDVWAQILELRRIAAEESAAAGICSSVHLQGKEVAVA